MTQLDTHVSLAHGNGGRFMRELINELFARHLANPYLDTGTDAAVLPWDAGDGQLVFTTDSFTVQPIEFPGGNIGSLAVHGTTNDLAVAGAVPRYLSLGVLLEEGLEFAVLERVVAGIAEAAREIGVYEMPMSRRQVMTRRRRPRQDRRRRRTGAGLHRAHLPRPRAGPGSGTSPGPRGSHRAALNRATVRNRLFPGRCRPMASGPGSR